MSPSEIKSLVTHGAKLDREIKDKADELKRLKALLVSLAPGEYQGEQGEVAKVIQPSPAIKPPPGAIGQAREIISDPDLFKKLFDRVVSYKPIANFRTAVAVALTPAKAVKVIALCEVDSQPYVVFS